MLQRFDELSVSNFKSKEFLEEQRKWYRRLKKEGFVDAEKVRNDGEQILIQSSLYAYRHTQRNNDLREEIQSYYHLIFTNVQREKFKKEVDRAVMSLVAEGKKIAEIVRELSAAGHELHRQTVRFIIRKWENKWGIRKWSPEQMKSKPHTP